MKVLYIDCGMGAAGDMLLSSLCELMPLKEFFVHELNNLGLPGVEYVYSETEKCGVRGSHISVLCNGEEEGEHMHDHGDGHFHSHSHGIEHNTMADIERIVVDILDVSEKVKNDILGVFSLIAKAESEVHGMPISNIHFHEVGTMDAIADITGVCYAIHKLKVDKIIASDVHVGSGTVKCAHGILPVPAPATAIILKGVPIYQKENINGELCTPTGAALLKYFVDEFAPMPSMTVNKIGYGNGNKDFPVANTLRTMLGSMKDKTYSIVKLECNIDDMTAEEIGYALGVLMENGALDAYTTAIGMKKNRPGTMFSVLCKEADKERMVSLIFRHTNTIGIREELCNRYVLDRWIEEEETELGIVRKKVSSGYGVTREKHEFDDIAKIAKNKGMSLMEVKDKLKN